METSREPIENDIADNNWDRLDEMLLEPYGMASLDAEESINNNLDDSFEELYNSYRLELSPIPENRSECDTMTCDTKSDASMSGNNNDTFKNGRKIKTPLKQAEKTNYGWNIRTNNIIDGINNNINNETRSSKTTTPGTDPHKLTSKSSTDAPPIGTTVAKITPVSLDMSQEDSSTTIPHSRTPSQHGKLYPLGPHAPKVPPGSAAKYQGILTGRATQRQGVTSDNQRSCPQRNSGPQKENELSTTFTRKLSSYNDNNNDDDDSRSGWGHQSELNKKTDKFDKEDKLTAYSTPKRTSHYPSCSPSPQKTLFQNVLQKSNLKQDRDISSSNSIQRYSGKLAMSKTDSQHKNRTCGSNHPTKDITRHSIKSDKSLYRTQSSSQAKPTGHKDSSSLSKHLSVLREGPRYERDDILDRDITFKQPEHKDCISLSTHLSMLPEPQRYQRGIIPHGDTTMKQLAHKANLSTCDDETSCHSNSNYCKLSTEYHKSQQITKRASSFSQELSLGRSAHTLVLFEDQSSSPQKLSSVRNAGNLALNYSLGSHLQELSCIRNPYTLVTNDKYDISLQELSCIRNADTLELNDDHLRCRRDGTGSSRVRGSSRILHIPDICCKTDGDYVTDVHTKADYMQSLPTCTAQAAENYRNGSQRDSCVETDTMDMSKNKSYDRNICTVATTRHGEINPFITMETNEPIKSSNQINAVNLHIQIKSKLLWNQHYGYYQSPHCSMSSLQGVTFEVDQPRKSQLAGKHTRPSGLTQFNQSVQLVYAPVYTKQHWKIHTVEASMDIAPEENTEKHAVRRHGRDLKSDLPMTSDIKLTKKREKSSKRSFTYKPRETLIDYLYDRERDFAESKKSSYPGNKKRETSAEYKNLTLLDANPRHLDNIGDDSRNSRPGYNDGIMVHQGKSNYKRESLLYNGTCSPLSESTGKGKTSLMEPLHPQKHVLNGESKQHVNEKEAKKHSIHMHKSDWRDLLHMKMGRSGSEGYSNRHHSNSGRHGSVGHSDHHHGNIGRHGSGGYLNRYHGNEFDKPGNRDEHSEKCGSQKASDKHNLNDNGVDSKHTDHHNNNNDALLDMNTPNRVKTNASYTKNDPDAHQGILRKRKTSGVNFTSSLTICGPPNEENIWISLPSLHRETLELQPELHPVSVENCHRYDFEKHGENYRRHLEYKWCYEQQSYSYELLEPVMVCRKESNSGDEYDVKVKVEIAPVGCRSTYHTWLT